MVLKRAISCFLTAILIICVIPAFVAASAKPSLNKKTVSVIQGKTVKLSLKNADTKARTVWKSGNSKVVRIVKKHSKGKKAYAKIKGIKTGKTCVTATYKAGNKKKLLKCKVKVIIKKSGSGAENSDSVDNKSKSKATATPKPTKKPAPTATPQPTKKPGSSPSIADSDVNDNPIEIPFDDIINS